MLRNLEALGGKLMYASQNSKVHVANMGPSWVLPAPAWPHVGPMKFVIRVTNIVQSIRHEASLNIHIVSKQK